MIISIDAEKQLTKFNIHSHSQQGRCRGKVPRHNKDRPRQAHSSHHTDGKALKTPLQDQGRGKDAPMTTFTQQCTESLSQTNDAKKYTKDIQSIKEEGKLSAFADDTVSRREDATEHC